ncbi:MAG: GFA family protein, partial [Caulobacteraceae bacterium]|nr:GFA family protein [Caulobacteraceae bacterium]
VTRAFCGDCGAQISYTHDDYRGERIDIATGTLDDPEAAPPLAHIFLQSRLSWMRGLDTLPGRYADFSPSSGQ